MANSHSDMFQNILEGNKYDPEPGLSNEEILRRAKAIKEGKDIDLRNTQVGYEWQEVEARQYWLQ